MREAGASEMLIALSSSLNFWRSTRLLEETGQVPVYLDRPEIVQYV
jgi:hypothetical protein